MAVPGESRLNISSVEADGNAEAALALGSKLDLAELGVYELELIPGISDTLAERVIAKKDVIRAADDRSFEVVKGIGPKTSKLLSEYIESE